MTRIFDRGELKQVLLAVVDSLGEGHGYAIMQELQRRVGGNWRASPGAIYPALLALEGEGLISGSDRDGLRVYRVTAQGEAALEESAASPSWEGYSRRAGASTPVNTLGRVLDRFAAQQSERRRRLDDEQTRAVEAVLEQARDKITTILKEGDADG
jgi:DNA-binding PadR family transcriptional regulator